MDDDRDNQIAVVAGGSGFVGSALIRALREDGYTVRRIGRSGNTTWDDPAGVAAAVDGANLLVNRTRGHRWVLPATLVEAGFDFRHPHLHGALADVAQREHGRARAPHT